MGNETCSNAVPAKIPRIAVYLDEELKDQVEKLAGAERRSLSQMCAILIEEAVKSRLSDSPPAPSEGK